METNKLIIAIDGPGAAGKSTVAKKLASKLHFTYIDTGAMYRCLALYALENKIDINDVEALVKAAKEIDIFLDHNGKVYLNGQDVTLDIRSLEVTKIVSPVSYPRKVREVFVIKQQALAAKSKVGVVIDGRDIGTVVLPQADLKIFQVADLDERVKRRYEENLQKGLDVSFEQIKEDIKQRDYLDTHKEYGALKKADDAIELDTTKMSIDEVVLWIYNKAMEMM